MARELRSMDISDAPELLRLAEEVREAGEPRLLRRNGEDLVIVSPVVRKTMRRTRRTRTEEDLAAFRAAAGSWSDVDTDKFLADNAHSRRISIQPPVEL
jgi:hypothetical protein